MTIEQKAYVNEKNLTCKMKKKIIVLAQLAHSP